MYKITVKAPDDRVESVIESIGGNKLGEVLHAETSGSAICVNTSYTPYQFAKLISTWGCEVE
ncbi:hypothetical protein CL635_01540 [bacterium]|nr:hypothetical protein [bacterium]|tara:strand:- start:248 stop:433 length:186 start_codon:yes stop_codon:yes gene_type:complete